MSPEIELRLKEKYPKTFSKLPYFECSDGWLFIIESIAKVIEQEIEKGDDGGDSLFCACQVKEKFGGLRFYTYGHNEIIDGAIRVGESMSYHVCEECGDAGELRKDLPWIRTLCSKHFEELNKKG